MGITIMIDLWKVLEEETSKAKEEKRLADYKEMVAMQSKALSAERIETFNLILANYVFNYFLINIFPYYISFLISKNHEILLQEKQEKIDGKIRLYSLSTASFLLRDGIEATTECKYNMWSFELSLYFKDKDIKTIFMEKLNQFLIKNGIAMVPTLVDSNMVNYLKSLSFTTYIDTLIKAYENGLVQIEEERENLKILMDEYNIDEEDICALLNIDPAVFKNLKRHTRTRK